MVLTGFKVLHHNTHYEHCKFCWPCEQLWPRMLPLPRQPYVSLKATAAEPGTRSLKVVQRALWQTAGSPSRLNQMVKATRGAKGHPATTHLLYQYRGNGGGREPPAHLLGFLSNTYINEMWTLEDGALTHTQGEQSLKPLRPTRWEIKSQIFCS